MSPLHLAASLGRSDVVSLLLEQDEIDDSVKDAQGRSVPDVATREVKEIIQGELYAGSVQHSALNDI